MSFPSFVTFASSNPYLVAFINLAALVAAVWALIRWGGSLVRFLWTWGTTNWTAARRRLTFATMSLALDAYHHPSVMLAALLRTTLFTGMVSFLMFAQGFDSFVSPPLFGEPPAKWTGAAFLLLGNLFLLRGLSFVFTLSGYVLAFHRRERARRIRAVRARRGEVG